MAADDFALVVGIKHYPQLTHLAGPVADAEAFRDWLTSPSGGDVPADQVQLVVSPGPVPADPLTAPPTLSEVQAKLDLLQQRGFDNDGVAGRRLWLYFAGHGVAPNMRDAALVMANANLNRLYHLPADPYLNWFRMAATFSEVVAIADCCRDHMGGRLQPFSMPWAPAASPGADVHYFTAFATKWSGKAREKPVNGSGQVRGIFTRALLEGLEQGRRTAKTLEDFVGQRLPELASQTEFQQPVFDYDIDLDLGGAVAAMPCTLNVGFAAEDAAVTVSVLDGAFKPLTSFPMTDGPRSVQLDSGLYAVRRSDKPDGEQTIVSVTEQEQDVVV